METYDYEMYEAGGGALLAFIAAFFVFIIAVGLVIYVIKSLFLMNLLKNTNHKYPFAAWVPIWGQVALSEVAGIRRPWIWMLIFLLGGALTEIPMIGWAIAIALTVAAIMWAIWVAKGVHAHLNMSSIPGIVLSVFFQTIWIIWMSIRSNTRNTNLRAAAVSGGTFPLNFFGESDPYASFNTPVNYVAYASDSNEGHQQSVSPVGLAGYEQAVPQVAPSEPTNVQLTKPEESDEGTPPANSNPFAPKNDSDE